METFHFLGKVEEAPDTVVLLGELSHASTTFVPLVRAVACAADSPVAAMSPPVSPCSTGRRPLWYAISTACSLVQQPLAYVHAISPAGLHLPHMISPLTSAWVDETATNTHDEAPCFTYARLSAILLPTRRNMLKSHFIKVAGSSRVLARVGDDGQTLLRSGGTSLRALASERRRWC